MSTKKILLLAVPLSLAASVPGEEGPSTSPYEVILTIPYGTQPGMLDTSREDLDDAEHTLVASFRVEDPLVYVKPLQSVLLDSVLCYEGGTFLRKLYVKGYSDFLIAGDGTIYSVSLPLGSSAYAWFCRQHPDGSSDRAELPNDALPSRPHRGRLQVIDGQVFMTNATELKHTVDLSVEPFPPNLTSSDVLEGVPSRSGRIWQNTLYIMRDMTPILDLGTKGGGLLWVFEDGGFVIGRGSVQHGSGPLHEVFECYDQAGRLVRTVYTLASWHRYNAEESFYFTPEHIYQLVLSMDAGRVLQY